jgi:predicted membrane channel-forming protein YqfA (hemolysin III family)
LIGAIPFVYYNTILSKTPFREVGTEWIIMSIVFYMTGGLVYGYKFPEKVYPGKFDIIVSLVTIVAFS